MTKDSLRNKLQKGHIVEDLFDFRVGQDCFIFKADTFSAGEEIIYIPDTCLNEIPVSRRPESYEQIEEILDLCYTGQDFIDECGGDVEKAERLFWYCDWQHPSSAIAEIEDDVDDPHAIPSSTGGDYGPSNPWDAPGMSISDFI